MTKVQFTFPMSVRERIGGIIYIPLHAAVIPTLVVLADSMIFQPKGISLSEAVINLAVYAIGFIFCILFMWKFLKKSFSDIFERKGFLRTVIGSVFIYYLLAVVVSTLLTAILGEFELVNPNTEGINSLIHNNYNVMAVMTVFFAPIVEECIFRGALFGTIRTKSRIIAYIVTILAFAIYHLWGYFVTDYSWKLWVYLLQYVPASLVLCRAYEKSGTVWCPIVLHAIINFVALNVTKLL